MANTENKRPDLTSEFCVFCATKVYTEDDVEALISEVKDLRHALKSIYAASESEEASGGEMFWAEVVAVELDKHIHLVSENGDSDGPR